ncbi:hypothetical protein MC885_013721 [Smutsia gigantea]|nr:hypothetical protein MC885_013721 [Smutsia gigantea]
MRRPAARERERGPERMPEPHSKSDRDPERGARPLPAGRGATAAAEAESLGKASTPAVSLGGKLARATCVHGGLRVGLSKLFGRPGCPHPPSHHKTILQDSSGDTQ